MEQEIEKSTENASENATAERPKRTKERSNADRVALINRLRRIEGQVRGIERMIDESAYCTDIIVQVSAVSAALDSFTNALLAEHIRTCVTNDILGGSNEAVEELIVLLGRLPK